MQILTGNTSLINDLELIVIDYLFDQEFCYNNITQIPKPIILRNINTIDWISISIRSTLSEAFIREYAHLLNWKWISVYQIMSESFMREFADHINWQFALTCQTLSPLFICEFADRIGNIPYSSRMEIHPTLFYDRNINIIWNYVSSIPDLSESFIRNCADHVNWELISQHATLSESFIYEFADRIHFDNICKYQKISTSFKFKLLQLVISRKLNGRIVVSGC